MGEWGWGVGEEGGGGIQRGRLSVKISCKNSTLLKSLL